MAFIFDILDDVIPNNPVTSPVTGYIKNNFNKPVMDIFKSGTGLVVNTFNTGANIAKNPLGFVGDSVNLLGDSVNLLGDGAANFIDKLLPDIPWATIAMVGGGLVVVYIVVQKI